MNHYAKMKRRVLPAAIAAATLGLLMSHATAAELTKIRMITSPQLPWPYGWELVEVADAKGFFEKQGLQLERVSLPPDQYSAAMESGRTDFTAYADYAYLINLVDKGVPVIEVVASSLMIDEKIAGDGLFVTANSPIKSAADLKGKTIGMTNVAFSSAWFTSEYLGKNGLSKDDVKYVNVPTGQQEQVLTSGDVDAMYVYGPLDAIFRTRPNEFRQLFKLSDLTGGPNIRGGTMALVSFAKEHPDIVRKYAAAIGEAANWANQNQAEVVQIMVDRGRVDPKLAAATYNPKGEADYSALRWPENGAQKEADVQFWLSLLEAQGIIEKGRLKPSDIYTNEFVNTAN